MDPNSGIPFSTGRYRHEVHWNFGSRCFRFHCLHTVPPVSAPPQICEQKKRQRCCRPVLLCKFTNRLHANSQKNVFLLALQFAERWASLTAPKLSLSRKTKTQNLGALFFGDFISGHWTPIFWVRFFCFSTINLSFFWFSSFFCPGMLNLFVFFWFFLYRVCLPCFADPGALANK